MQTTNNTLLVIDVQNGFIKEPTKELPGQIATRIAEGGYEHVLFTQFINTPHSNFVRLLGWDKLFESPEIDIAPELLAHVSEDRLFRKDTYSAFMSEKLLFYLKENGIEEIDLCGIDLEGCVLASAYHAFDLGLRPRILRDFSLSTGAERMDDAAWKIIERNLVKAE